MGKAPMGRVGCLSAKSGHHEGNPSTFIECEAKHKTKDASPRSIRHFVNAVVADVVKLDFVPPRHGSGTAVIEWDEACLDMAKRNINPSRYDQMFGLLYEAMVGGARLKEFHSSRLPAPHWVQDHKDWRSSLESWMENGAPSSYMMPKTTSRFNNSVGRASKGRRFFIGAKALMGQGPRDIEAGDLMCILYGRPTPFILRPNADENTYRLLGEAYVNLVMSGYAFDIKEKFSIEDKTFVIT